MIPSQKVLHPGDLQAPQSSRRITATLALIAFWFLAATSITIAASLLVWEMHEREVARAEREVANLGRILAEQTARAVQGVDLILRGTEDRLREGRASATLMDDWSIHNLLYARITGVPQVHVLSQINAEGLHRHSSAEFPVRPIALGDRGYFRVHHDSLDDRIVISPPVLSRLDGKWLLPMTCRINGPGGEFAGVVLAGISPPYFEELYRSIALGEGSEVSLLLRDGTLIAHHPHQEEAIGKAVEGFPAVANGASLPGIERSEEPTATIVGYGEVKGYPLVVRVAVAESAVLADWRQQATGLAVGAAITLFVLTLAMLALGKKMIREEALAAALGDSSSRLQGIIDSAMDAIITVDDQQRIVLFNPAAEQMFGCPAADALGASLERFIPERYRTPHRQHMANFGATGSSNRTMGGNMNIVACRASGEEFPADISISQVARNSHKLFTAIIRDITLRRRAAAELEKSHQQLRDLTNSLETVREDERTRIARELHDELGQQLTGLKMDLSWMESRLPEGNTALAAKVDSMKKLINATVASTRRISAELRPLVLDDLGLSAALDWLARDFSGRSGLEVSIDIGPDEWVLDNALATTIFRIAQESLTNVARHAEATRVRISLAQSGGQLILAVADNGRGMAPDATEKRGHFGLLGIAERVRAFAGELQISSRPGEGTTLSVSIPLPPAAPEGNDQ
ncbi:MAG TPA: PAS domain S-box protein [Rhodocyclaceae bacterium]|nr:PAS domain S-box protein [Rhodocyclaceae bacterium]